MRTAGRRRAAGFTLIEVMVAMAIFALLLMAVYGTFSAAQRSISQADAQSDSYQLSRAVLEQVTGDLTNIYPLQLTQREVDQTAPEQADATEEQWAFKHEDNRDDRNDVDLDSLSFVSAVTDPVATQTACSELAEITYFLDQDDSTPEAGLVRMINRLPGLAAEPIEPEVAVISAEVASLNFRFWDRENGEWLDEWETTDQLPPLIEVTVGILQQTGKGTQQPQLLQAVIEPRSQGLPPELTAAKAEGKAGQPGDEAAEPDQPGEQQPTPAIPQLPGGAGGLPGSTPAGPAFPGGRAVPQSSR